MRQPHLDKSRATPHPVNSLLLLLGLVFTGALIGSIFGLLVGFLFTDVDDIAAVAGALLGQTEHLGFFRIVQAGSAVGMFLLPPIILGLIEGDKYQYIRRQQPGTLALYLLVLVIVWASGAISDLLGTLNSMLTLPERWADIEAWMQAQEEQLAEVTLQLLKDTSVIGLLGNLLVIAIIAAIGEEFLFRGALQTILHRWLRNPHIAISITAIIFSAIHLQFYGFLPRLFLGLIFGYLFFWSGNIWLAVFAHFINNASVVITAFIVQKRGQPLDGMDLGFDVPPIVYFISFVLVIWGLWKYWQLNEQKLGQIVGRYKPDRNGNHEADA